MVQLHMALCQQRTNYRAFLQISGVSDSLTLLKRPLERRHAAILASNPDRNRLTKRRLTATHAGEGITLRNAKYLNARIGLDLLGKTLMTISPPATQYHSRHLSTSA